MIRVVSIEICGKTERGPFVGRLDFEDGLNVFSGRNAFGKSAAITAIPWCLGLEPMFGLQNNDPARFPAAVRDMVIIENVELRVLSSEARLTLERSDGAMVSIRRAIIGDDREKVEVTETFLNRTQRVSILQARKDTMADESAGLQRFLFAWIGLPRASLMAMHGRRSELYFENLAPLFFIDQTEGWTDLFALQVHRYGLQEVNEAAVEYLLGAMVALERRFRAQETVSIEARLKGEAERIAARVVEFFRLQGWTVAWSTRGTTVDIAKRWAGRTLSEVARREFRMDVARERELRTQRLTALRAMLAETPDGTPDRSPASQASQAVVELKTQRHELRTKLRDARLQLAEQRTLLATLEHRTNSSKDVLKLKQQGIGRLDHVECPTCHRDLDPSTFELTPQSSASVAAHIDALEKQRVLIRDNIGALVAEGTRLEHDLVGVEERLTTAERSLGTVNLAVGATREALAKIANDIAVAQRDLDALSLYATEVASIEADIRRWIDEVGTVLSAQEDDRDRLERKREFEAQLRRQLLALGHSAVTPLNAPEVRLDDSYIPYLGPRRLRSLGSASDHPRLVAAYVLALADASLALKGPHPGFVVLDEPQQQNPDESHVELFLRFLSAAAKETGVQVIITTHLKKEEVARLEKEAVPVIELPPGNLLEARTLDLREELPRLLATLTREDAVLVEEALIASVLRESAVSPSVYRPIERRIGKGGERVVVRWQDLDPLEAAILAAAALAAAKTLLVPLAALVVLLWKYRRRQVVLEPEAAQIVLLLKRAPTTGWTVDEILAELPKQHGLSKAELETRLASLKAMRDASGREIPLVTINDGKWRVLDV
jgi:predicted  nucleic acid-binding Zn-ribbon protein